MSPSESSERESRCQGSDRQTGGGGELVVGPGGGVGGGR